MTAGVKPACKKMRALGKDLDLKGYRAPETKCKMEVPPGQHGGSRRRRVSDYGLQLRAKQTLRYVYGVLEKQFRKYFKEAARRKGSTGENLLQILESRLDNVVFRAGFAATRAEARQLISHKAILVNDKVVNIRSYKLAAGDKIAVSEKARAQLRIKAALELAQQRSEPEWIDVDGEAFSALYKTHPMREELPSWYQEQLVVELYSK